MALNERLVVTSVTEFGLTGPYRDWQGEEIVHWAMGGYMHFVGSADREPLLTPNHQAQQHAGGQAAIASLVALRRARIDGLGQHIGPVGHGGDAGGAQLDDDPLGLPRRGAEAHRLTAPSLQERVGPLRGDLPQPQLPVARRAARPARRPALHPRRGLDAGAPATPCSTCSARGARRSPRRRPFGQAQELGLPVAPAYDVADHMASPHLRARGWPTTVEHPRNRRDRTAGLPLPFFREPGGGAAARALARRAHRRLDAAPKPYHSRR